MKDSNGIELRKGQLVYWISRGLRVNIIDINEPVIESGPSTIIFAIPVPVEIPSGRSPKNLLLEDFIVCVNPAQQEQLEAMMDKMKGVQ